MNKSFSSFKKDHFGLFFIFSVACKSNKNFFSAKGKEIGEWEKKNYNI